MSRLTCYVYVTDNDGVVHGFGPGSAVPGWAREKITNPHVWADKMAPPTVVTVAAQFTDRDIHAAVGTSHDVSASVVDGPPPQGGTGATRQRWAEYATGKGVEVESDWKREDIIAACELAGVPV